MAPGKATKRAKGAPKQQQEQQQQQERQQQQRKHWTKRKPRKSDVRDGERTEVRWEELEELAVEVTSARLVALEGLRTGPQKKDKREKRKQQARPGQGDTLDDDALVGIDDDDEEEADDEHDEIGTFGGRTFVLLDVEDELEQLQFDACALSINDDQKGRGQHLRHGENPSASSKKKKKKKNSKEVKQDLASPNTLAHSSTASVSLLVGTEKKADKATARGLKIKKPRDSAKQQINGATPKDSAVAEETTQIKAKKKKKDKDPVSPAADVSPVDQKKHRNPSRPGGDIVVSEKTQRTPRSHGQSKRQERTNDADKSNTVYTEYLTRDVVTQGLEDGSFLQGKLRVNAMYRMDGYVTVDGISMDILIKGMADRNRAVDGDLVAIKLHPEDEWKALGNASDDFRPAASVSTAEQAATTHSAPEIDTDALHSLWRPNVDTSKCLISTAESADIKQSDANSKLKAELGKITERIRECRARPTASVIFVLAAGNSAGFIGCLEPRMKMTDVEAPLPSDDAYAYFNAHDQRLPRRIQIPRLQLPDEFIRCPLVYSKTMLCFCRIKTWSTKFRSPRGEFVKTVGEYTGIDTGISAILSKNDLQAHTLDFDSAILEELDAKYGASGEKWNVPDEEVAKRRDFREYQIFSIDPYNARDLDDALHIRALNEARTTFEIGVHIADVTHFMEYNSLLDKEARSRATSVYLPNRVLPMLPRILCEKLCSLQPRVDRLAFSVVWQMNIDGTLVDGVEPWFGKSIIRSCCKLDYGSAQKMLDGTISPGNLDEWETNRRPIADASPSITTDSVIQSVQDLWAIGENRRTMRFDTGAISLNDVKLVFTLDAKGNPTRFGPYQIKDSNRLVEEYMLLANFLVAQKLLQAHGPLAFIRHHPAPVDRALELALGTLKEHAIEIDGSAAKTLSDSLDRVRRDHGETVFAIAQAMLIKPMKPAEYMVAGNGASSDSWRHYALNIPYYTHFTSPIRRYADVVVHRLLQESVAGGSVASSSDIGARLVELTSVAQNCNDKKMAAKAAEKECDEVFLCAYVKHLSAADVTGVVMSSGQQSFTVYIMELGIERRLFLKDLHVTGTWDDTAKELTIQLPASKDKKAKKRKDKSQRDRKDDDVDCAEIEGEEDKRDVPLIPPRRLRLAFMTQVRLKMSATNKMPLALTFALVGAAGA